MTLSGTPLSCAHDEYVRRNVNQVTFGNPRSAQTGNTERRSTLLGESGFPKREQKTKSSIEVNFVAARHADNKSRAKSHSGITRLPAFVFGELKTPSYTASL